MVFLERFDQQEIDVEPDRPAPVGIPSQGSGGRFTRLVIQRKVAILCIEVIWMRFVILADRANTIVAQEFLGVKHAFEELLQIGTAHEGQHRIVLSLVLLAILPARNQAWDIGAVFRKPAHALIEKVFYQRCFRRLYRQEWNKPDQRAHIERKLLSTG